jgi:hypothetical protein
MILNLWDEKSKRLISFGDLKKLGYFKQMASS